jgi:hypothetical protein
VNKLEDTLAERRRSTPIDNICASCRALLCPTTVPTEVRPPHKALVMDWNNRRYGIYFCTTCKACLVREDRDFEHEWRWSPVYAASRVRVTQANTEH